MMGTQASRNESIKNWSDEKIKSSLAKQNKYNPTQPSQFAKTITSEQYKVLCQDRKQHLVEEENNKPQYAIVGDHTPIMPKAVSESIESIKNRQSISIE